MATFRLCAAAAGFTVAAFLTMTAHAQTETVTAPTQPESGFKVVVVGVMPGTSPEEFSRAVAESLPPTLVDPETNFTNDPAYRPERDYRLVMAFHGEDIMDAPALCTQPGDVEAEPPSPTDLMTATRVTGAFCANGEALSTATDRMLGSITPGQAGFRFLVSDIAKQLFPDGFNTMPGTAGAGPPPGTAVTPIR